MLTDISSSYYFMFERPHKHFFTNTLNFAVRPFKFQVSAAVGLLFNLLVHCRAISTEELLE